MMNNITNEISVTCTYSMTFIHLFMDIIFTFVAVIINTIQ
jgi:hypothetical protein